MCWRVMRPECFRNGENGSIPGLPLVAHLPPQSSAQAGFIQLHDPSNGETFWRTPVEGGFGSWGSVTLVRCARTDEMGA